jgi:hypothetical protein
MELSETTMTDLFLTCDQKVLGRAILALDNTNIPELGWDETDIVFGKYLATWARNGKKFTGTFLLKARLLMIKYRFQMSTIAREKAARKEKRVLR